jgi:hypothetical protein
LLDVPIIDREINIPVLCGWLREQKPDHAFIEFACARPGQESPVAAERNDGRSRRNRRGSRTHSAGC